jgi:hypothetical protein
MTMADDILHLLRLRPGGMTDAELAQATGKIHQQINQRCRALAKQGVLVREPIGGIIRNRLHIATAAPQLATTSAAIAHAGDRDWFWEGNVQAALCEWLNGEGWSLDRVANTAVKERGTDIEATRAGTRLHIEVKGYPSVNYADPRRAGEAKRTRPTMQAKHWYAEALLKAVRLRDKHPDDHIAMAFPDYPRYRILHDETSSSLGALRIDVLLVSETGAVTRAE